MPVTEDQQREPGSARETINQMLDAGLLDDVMARADSGELALTGDGGFLPEMIKAVLERDRAAEPTGHSGMSAETLPGGAARTSATAPPSRVTTGAGARS